MGTDKIFPSLEKRENNTSSKFMNFSWVDIGGGEYKRVGWDTGVLGSDLWLNAASVFTA